MSIPHVVIAQMPVKELARIPVQALVIEAAQEIAQLVVFLPALIIVREIVIIAVWGIVQVAVGEIVVEHQNKRTMDIMSRRCFFRNFANKVLPIFLMTTIPALEAKSEPVYNNCRGDCMGSCRGNCKGSCKGNCKGNCKGGCSFTCKLAGSKTATTTNGDTIHSITQHIIK